MLLMVLLDAALPPIAAESFGHPIRYTRGFISFMNYPIGAPPAPSAARLAHIMVPTWGGPRRASIGSQISKQSAPRPVVVLTMMGIVEVAALATSPLVSSGLGLPPRR